MRTRYVVVHTTSLRGLTRCRTARILQSLRRPSSLRRDAPEFPRRDARHGVDPALGNCVIIYGTEAPNTSKDGLDK